MKAIWKERSFKSELSSHWWWTHELTLFSELLSDEELSDDDDDDDDDDDESQDSEHDEDVVMTDTLNDEQRVARQKAMDDLVPGLPPSEYGTMPPSYSNSQRVARTTMETEVREESSESGQKNAESLGQQRSIRPPILPRDEYEGVVDSDDESEEEVDEEEEEEQPQVVGEIEIDMEEEQDEFLEFARQALGVSDEEWTNIIDERKSRGGSSTFNGDLGPLADASQ